MCDVATLSGKYVSLWSSNQQYQRIGKLQWRSFSFCNERQVPMGIKSLQRVIEINIKLLWVLQAFTSRHGQTGFSGQLFHILYQSKQLDIPPSWCPQRKRHDITPKRGITGVSKHVYPPIFRGTCLWNISVLIPSWACIVGWDELPFSPVFPQFRVLCTRK